MVRQLTASTAFWSKKRMMLLSRYVHLDDPAVAESRARELQIELATNEHLVGIYANPPGEDIQYILVTTSRIMLKGPNVSKAMGYAELERAELRGPMTQWDELSLVSRDGCVMRVRMTDPSGTKPATTLVSFLMKVSQVQRVICED